ncbi:hypothetical protein DFH06DRAFT_1322578 [Mycena polygramma]|nr:hypothetical protein DFH06DRAFT_1322578 [Mycena polygramma]
MRSAMNRLVCVHHVLWYPPTILVSSTLRPFHPNTDARPRATQQRPFSSRFVMPSASWSALGEIQWTMMISDSFWRPSADKPNSQEACRWIAPSSQFAGSPVELPGHDEIVGRDHLLALFRLKFWLTEGEGSS